MLKKQIRLQRPKSEQLEPRHLLSSISVVSSDPVLAESDERFAQQAEMQPFPLEAGLFQVYSNFGQVGRIDVASGIFVNADHRVGEKINAAGFHSADRFAYGILTASTTLGRIDANGNLERMGTVSGLPTDRGTYFVGDFANDLLYVRNSKELTKLYGIDVDTMSVADIITTNASMSNIYDIAFNPKADTFYACRRGAENSLIAISLTGNVRTVGNNGLQKLTFGGMYADSEGSIFGVANQTGDVYRFETDTGIATWVAQGPASGTNDGFSNSDVVLELPPTAVDDAFQSQSYERVTGNVFADNGSGSDVDGNNDQMSIVAVEETYRVGEVIDLPSGAEVVVEEDGTFHYDSNGVFDQLSSGTTATDSFRYTIADDVGLQDTGTVTLTIHGVASPTGFEGVTINGLERYGIKKSEVVFTNVGDLNNDGFDDAMIAVDSAFNGAGGCFLVNGSAEGIDETMFVDSLFPENGGDGSLGSVFVGAKLNDRAGRSIAKLGDVNGDGIDDVAISSTDADPNGIVNAGKVYVIFGRTNGLDAMLDLAEIESSNGELGFVLSGTSAHDLIGQTIKGVGDFNDDGLNDLAIAARMQM